MSRVAAIVPSLRTRGGGYKPERVTDIVVNAIMSKHVFYKDMRPRAHIPRAEREKASRERQQRRGA